MIENTNELMGDLTVGRVRSKLGQEYLPPKSRLLHDDQTFLALKSTGIELKERD